MDEGSRLFAEQLRRTRLAAGLSLSELAKRVHYSKGYLSKIETGAKAAGIDLARRCDAALGAEGMLTALITQPGTAATRPDSPEEAWTGEVWMMNLDSGGSTWFNPVRRRDALASGAALLTLGLTERRASAAVQDESNLQAFQAIFEQHRKIGQTMSPVMVLPSLIAQTHTLRELAMVAKGQTRERYLRLASRYAEYTGWMTQETGNDKAALWWTRTAVEMAGAAGDHDVAAHSLVRHALITLYREDAVQTIELAQQAQADAKAPARIRGMAALREAQGHALAGDDRNCRSTLDRAVQLLESVGASDGMVLGTTSITSMGPLVTAWCLYDLGRPGQAAELLDTNLTPAMGRRAHTRFGARRALAHAAAGEIDQACVLAEDVLDSAELVDSATIRFDLRRLARTLARWSSHKPVRELQPRLTSALHAPVS
ncbi:helix-turn-helix transcriptional regulator [Actinocrispum sp. NPDC049592]|uniref:helix-turn-helix domain-containing protein n=1 Tax=Actinocrispum sp. NPDC049592 TaxID=3154835 RepID=UPI00341277BA